MVHKLFQYFSCTKNFKKNSGLTLVELMVASVLIGIVMIGIISFSFAIRNIQEASSRSTLLSMRVAGVMAHISKNASQSIGFSGDPGIVLGNELGGSAVVFDNLSTSGVSNDGENQAGATWISFRQDIQNSPENFDDDLWHIYRMVEVTGPPISWNLYYCTQVADPLAVTPIGPIPDISASQPCSTNNAELLLANVYTLPLNSFYFRVESDPNAAPNPTFYDTVGGLQFYVYIRIDTVYDALEELDPIDNPQYTIETKISPLAHSW